MKMKTNMNMKRPILLTALFLCAALLAAAPARAQSQDTNRDITIQNGILSIDKKEIGPANLKNAVAALRRLYPDVNIVLEPGVDQIQIGDIELHSAKPELVLEAFSFASGRQFVCGGQSAALFVISGNKHTTDAKPEKKVAAFNLSRYLALKNPGATTNDAQIQAEIKAHVEGLKQIIANTIDSLHPASEGGFGGMMGAAMGGQPRTRIGTRIDFYPDASLLIVIGSEQDLEAARVVINALPGMDGTSAKSLFQNNLRRVRGEEDTKPVEPKTPALPAAPVQPQNPSP